jgi:uncharacterized protein YndB with AHSA1/START domain
VSERGTVTDDGDETVTIRFRRIYRHRREHVWDAIATVEGLRGWGMCTSGTIDGRVGGAIELVSGPAQYLSVGRILRWEPPSVFEYEWNVEPVPEMPRGQHAMFCFELVAQGDATLLLATYRRITRAVATGFAPGVHALLDRLEAQLDGRAIPDWFACMDELRALYPEWQGHATAAGQ